MSLPVLCLPSLCFLATVTLEACPAAMADDTASVEVIRGGEVGSWTDSTSASVVVMRPASGSFMREPSRLAAKADAREERLARLIERETGMNLAEALLALQATAYASTMSTDTGWPVFLPQGGHRPPPPSRPRAPVARSTPRP